MIQLSGLHGLAARADNTSVGRGSLCCGSLLIVGVRRECRLSGSVFALWRGPGDLNSCLEVALSDFFFRLHGKEFNILVRGIGLTSLTDFSKMVLNGLLNSMISS